MSPHQLPQQAADDRSLRPVDDLTAREEPNPGPRGRGAVIDGRRLRQIGSDFGSRFCEHWIHILSSRDQERAVAPFAHLASLVRLRVHADLNQLLSAAAATTSPSSTTLLVVIEPGTLSPARILDLLSYLQHSPIVTAPVLYASTDQAPVLIELMPSGLTLTELEGEPADAAAEAASRQWRAAHGFRIPEGGSGAALTA